MKRRKEEIRKREEKRKRGWVGLGTREEEEKR